MFALCDVSNLKDAGRTVAATVDKFGGLDILVNNAGIEKAGTVVELHESDWDKVIGVNLKGVSIMSKYAIPELGKRKGIIVNTASVAGFVSYGATRLTAHPKEGGGVDTGYGLGPCP